MPKVTATSSRKADHIRINLEEDVRSSLGTGLERYHFTHQALPELDLEVVDLTQKLFGRVLEAPVLISSMTGGTPKAGELNRILAAAAQATGIAMGLGSQRAAIEDPALAATFQVRQVAPDILLLANLGAIQLNYGYGVTECQRAVDMIAADALILHLNALQEAVQPEGDTRFSGLLTKIEAVCKKLTVPVIAKEVGWGISAQAARQLADAGIAAIDVAGAGGTSWSQVEMYRAQNKSQARLAAAFMDWGIPTAESIIQVRQSTPSLPVFASGGIHSGVEIAKSIALGASLGGMAGPFLKAASHSLDQTILTIQEITREIRVTMFAAGAANLSTLQNTPLSRYQE
ncbi:MAG: type 2 isopentenyl-diphosphate Delta-isomerase [Anaerolineae bacterium]|nr:type 2 isopentenyl-diphosphate Delta-isomerase [Anaerolineae bacterium]MBL6966105.1 type 2 isopentenyl-diphosphate Delta-isomerase [Anaerolineales bacterium]